MIYIPQNFWKTGINYLASEKKRKKKESKSHEGFSLWDLGKGSRLVNQCLWGMY